MSKVGTHSAAKKRSTPSATTDALERLLLFAVVLLCFSGCQISQYRHKLASQISQERFEPVVYHTQPFDILAWEQPNLHPITKLRIYIEGDGLAWVNRYQPSSNPTPTDPIALRLAVADSTSKVLYLARPCQYVPLTDPPCNTLIWTEHRFHPDVLNSYQQVLDQMKQKWQIRSFELVGFSGGGVIAALLAAHRSDVDLLITVAAPLSLNVWVSYHQISPLTGSLDPVNFVTALKKIPQCHFVGKKDRVVPQQIVEDYQAQLDSKQSRIFLEETSHERGWVDHWTQLLGKCSLNSVNLSGGRA
jgi:hypothetical protein